MGYRPIQVIRSKHDLKISWVVALRNYTTFISVFGGVVVWEDSHPFLLHESHFGLVDECNFALVEFRADLMEFKYP